MMEKREFIEALLALVGQEDVLSSSKDVRDLRGSFEDYLIEEERQAQIRALNAQERGEEIEELDWISPIKEEFYTIYSEYKEKLHKIIEEKRKMEEENLRQKRELIHELRVLIQEEENIGVAFAKQKEINERWKSIGALPRTEGDEVQKEYERLLDDFFYNIKIYKQIKDYDLEINYKSKKEIIEKLAELSKLDKIKDIEAGLKTLQDDWSGIGPTKNELWEEIKDEYWRNIHLIYDKIHAFYDERRERWNENIEQKKALIEKMNDLLGQTSESVKEWNIKTKAVIQLQDDWKALGRGPRKEGEKVWQDFRSLCDEFFARKGEFFKGIQDEFDVAAEKKKALIDEAEALKDSQEWRETTRAIKEIQNRWKKIGNSGQRNEQRLWKTFRAACDHFFTAKEAFYAENEKKLDGNLLAKQDLIAKMKEITLPESKEESLELLRSFAQEFSKIGHVPRVEKDRIYQEYKEILDKHYNSLDLKGIEKQKVMYRAKLNAIKASDNPRSLFDKERHAIRMEMETIKKQIVQFENNLGFFSNSKGKNPLLEQAEKSLKAEREKLEVLVAKLKLIQNE